ncbi:hypothetical protein K501DRAFT_281192, partial [Backusella circina FSU 941]
MAFVCLRAITKAYYLINQYARQFTIQIVRHCLQTIMSDRRSDFRCFPNYFHSLHYATSSNDYIVPPGYADLAGKPTQRVLHNVLMNSDKVYLYFFLGLIVDDNFRPHAEIFQYNIKNSTFNKYDNFTLVGPDRDCIYCFGG